MKNISYFNFCHKFKSCFRSGYPLLLVDGDDEEVTDIKSQVDWFHPESGKNLIL